MRKKFGRGQYMLSLNKKKWRASTWILHLAKNKFSAYCHDKYGKGTGEGMG
jgi:hypothetical protein